MQTQLLINGQWQSSPQSFVVSNPATGEPIATVSDAMDLHLEQALVAAQHAFGLWRHELAANKEKLLLKFANLVMSHQDRLAQLICQESGKPLTEAVAEVQYAASFLQWFAGEARRIDGDLQASNSAGRQLLNRKKPLGVVAAITPWNFPAAMVTRKLGAALAAGCVVILKPSELTPLTALALAELAQQAGFPAGVVQVVPLKDAKRFGDLVTTDPRVQKITFTGSTQIGLKLHQQAAPSLKRISLELGGNAPAIVFNDADIPQAAAAIVAAKFRNSGQTCVCINRILVQAGCYENFSAQLRQAISQLQVGPGQCATSQVGPLIRPSDVTRLTEWVDQAVNAGAKLVYQSSVPDPLRYYPVTLLEQVTADMQVCQRELFGPVATLQVFVDEADAIAKANTGQGGLAAYVFSKDPALCYRVADALDAGMVGINDTAISDASIPFGGVGLSGIGREGSRYGVDDYVELQHLCWRW
ncbi:MAG TPA: succinate-semialdehyde dehydrogenase (NADP(+)) [Rheinheimera sp.]|nr:succinate-semialdehyde dehydrogenase (NADP(+)) [Rheinheimera sp.]